MAFVAAATSVGAAVLGTGAAAGIGSTLVGGALIGAGVGGLYSAITGDGNILNSMLTGGLIGGAGAGLGSAMGLGKAATASAPSTLAAPTSNVVTGTAAQNVAAQQAAANAANLEALALAEGSTTAGMVPAANTGLAANTVIPASMQITPPAPLQTGTGLSGKKMLGYGLAGSAALSLLGGMNQPKIQGGTTTPSYIRPYTYSSTQTPATGVYPSPYARTEYDMAGNPIMDTRERNYFDQSFTAQEPYQAASGGLMNSTPVERMSIMDQQRGMYPQGMIDKTYYSTPIQRPASMEVVNSGYDGPMNPMVGLPPVRMANGGYTYDQANQRYSEGAPSLSSANIPANFDPEIIKAYQAQNPNLFNYDPVKQRYAAGLPNQDQYNAFVAERERRRAEEMGRIPGMFGFFTRAAGLNDFVGYAAGGQAGGEYNLGSYSDGGRLLKGPGDGMSDNIPATIGKKQPARLADGEFVVPADVVSHLGNGSTDAGAKRLYAMMDKVRKARTGNKKQGKEIKAEKFIPA